MKSRRQLTTEEKWAEYSRASGEVLVDFDNTLMEWAYPGMGEPIPRAGYFMRALIARGLKPVVWSSRMSPEIYTHEERAAAIEKIARWLHKHDIPYHSIDTGENGKRLCLAYVDDRGVHANGQWEAMLRRVDQIRRTVEPTLRKKRGPDEVVDRN